MELYQQFAKHIRRTFLSDDKKGDFVSLVVDEQSILNLEKLSGASLTAIARNINSNRPCAITHSDAELVLSMVVLQLYAVSMMEDCNNTDQKYTVRAYYTHLNTIFCGDSYRKWLIRNDDNYITNQDKIWELFYKWCDSNNFIIDIKDKLSPQQNEITRNTQYPLGLAKYTFNRKDLRYIAYIFDKFRLQPNEDIAYNDFWRVIDVRSSFYGLNNHIDKILRLMRSEKNSYDIAKSQIFNHFLNWDGSYIYPYTDSTKKVQSLSKSLHLYYNDGRYSIRILDDSDRLLESILVDVKVSSKLRPFYRCKCDGVIVFQKNNIYPNSWDEVRHIVDKQDKGVAIVFDRSNYHTTFSDATQLFSDGRVIIYEFEYNHRTQEFYSEEANVFELLGGLKVGRRKYLEGGAPILRLHKDALYLLDGQTVTQKAGDYILDLPAGKHLIKFQRKKELVISIVSPSVTNIEWSEKYTNWNLSAREYKWLPTEDELGIIGLDFRCYSANKSKSKPSLTRWCQANQNKIVDDDSNITIKLLNNLNRYE